MLTTIDHTHPRIAAAIKFVEDEIKVALKHSPPGTRLYPIFEARSWIHYGPVLDEADKIELSALIAKFGTTTPDDIRYYLYYHGCYMFAVFYWTVLSVASRNPRIAVQDIPFPHCYLVVDGVTLDPLLHYVEATYPHGGPSVTLYDTPYHLYTEVFIAPTNRDEWEIAQLATLKQLE